VILQRAVFPGPQSRYVSLYNTSLLYLSITELTYSDLGIRRNPKRKTVCKACRLYRSGRRARSGPHGLRLL
jgi:hypothetical protein